MLEQPRFLTANNGKPVAAAPKGEGARAEEHIGGERDKGGSTPKSDESSLDDDDEEPRSG